MRLPPILAALRRHKAGVLLIAMQIALTLAIVCNSIFIIGQRIHRLNRPTGLDENNLFVVSQSWVGATNSDDPASIDKLDAMQLADVETLRRLPDVASVAAISSLPLSNSINIGGVNLKPDQKKPTAFAAFYFGDEHVQRTLGLHLIAGRGFVSSDIQHIAFRGKNQPSIVILTKALADKLFPHTSAVGKSIYLNNNTTATTVVGVYERLQTPTAETWANQFAWNALQEPVRLDGYFSRYAVRAKPGRLNAAMREARDALYASNPLRVIDDERGLQSFASIRADAYRADRGMAILMGMICVILLGVTSAGIVGLTSFWVGQRHKQIGIRRALGARRVDIVRYFQTENLLIAGAGAVVGVALSVALNIWLMRHFEMQRVPLLYVLLGVTVVMLLGQAAVFVPARRASNVPPVVATRSV